MYEVFGSFETSRQACRKQKNTVKTSIFAITKRRKSVRKRVQKLKNPPPGPAACGTAKKNVANQKIEVKKLKNTGYFHFSLADFANRCLPYCFLQCFLKASVTTYQKQEVLAAKCPPPPGKPVTFYECHPEDHAPAPSVRADFWSELQDANSNQCFCPYSQVVGGNDSLTLLKFSDPTPSPTAATWDFVPFPQPEELNACRTLPLWKTGE